MKIQLTFLILLLSSTFTLVAQASEPEKAHDTADISETNQTPVAVDDIDSAKTPDLVKASYAMTPKDEALIQSVSDGDLAAVELLVKKGANVNAVESKKKRTPLMWASVRGQFEIVKFLYDKGADVNAKDSDSQSALMYASRGQVKATLDNAIAEFLLNNGAEVNVKSKKKGLTALMIAASTGNVELVRQLLAKGADPTIKNNFGLSAVAMAQKTGKTAVVDILSGPPKPEGDT